MMNASTATATQAAPVQHPLNAPLISVGEPSSILSSILSRAICTLTGQIISQSIGDVQDMRHFWQDYSRFDGITVDSSYVVKTT